MKRETEVSQVTTAPILFRLHGMGCGPSKSAVAAISSAIGQSRLEERGTQSFSPSEAAIENNGGTYSSHRLDTASLGYRAIFHADKSRPSISSKASTSDRKISLRRASVSARRGSKAGPPPNRKFRRTVPLNNFTAP